jgi:hypothetical protein
MLPEVKAFIGVLNARQTWRKSLLVPSVKDPIAAIPYAVKFNLQLTLVQKENII